MARKLLRLVEIAELLDVTKQRVDQLAADLWTASDVRRWAKGYYGPSGKPKPRRGY